MSALPLLAIFGPTSAGKTEIAIEVSRLMSSRGILSKAVSADAYAVYREIPIITGAPTAAQQADLPHSCVGTHSVSDSFSVGSFSQIAHQEIDSIREGGELPIVVGGTGLYLRGAVSVLDLQPPVDPEIRISLMSELRDVGPEPLHARLAGSLPDAAAAIEPGDSQRIVRALELLEAGKTPRTVGSTGLWESPPRVPTVAVALVMERQSQRERIAQRIESMLAAGAVQEVQEAWSVRPSQTARAAIGMEELRTGDVDRMRTRTWQFAKRQMTWLRRLSDVAAIDVTDRPPESVAAEIVGLYDQASST